MFLISSFGNKIKYRTRLTHFNLEDFLREYYSGFKNSEEIFLNNISTENNPIYRFGEGPKEIEVTMNYSPIEEKLSPGICKVKGNETAKLKFLIDSKQGLFFKQYLITKLE